MSWLFLLFACSGEPAPAPVEGQTPEPVAVPVPAEEAAPRAAPSGPACDEAALTAIVKTSDAIAEPMRPAAQIQRPVCKDGWAYAHVGFGGPEAAVVIFQAQGDTWKVHDLGTGLDCADPAEPLTPALCADLEKSWK